MMNWAFTAGLGPEYYREEIRYRRQLALTRVMVRLTKVITLVTVIMTTATLYNIFGSQPVRLTTLSSPVPRTITTRRHTATHRSAGRFNIGTPHRDAVACHRIDDTSATIMSTNLMRLGRASALLGGRSLDQRPNSPAAKYASPV